MNDKFNNVNVDSLKDSEKKLLASVINSLGSGDHPWADFETIQFFAEDYVFECINKGLNSEASEPAKMFLSNIKEKMEVDNGWIGTK